MEEAKNGTQDLCNVCSWGNSGDLKRVQRPSGQLVLNRPPANSFFSDFPLGFPCPRICRLGLFCLYLVELPISVCVWCVRSIAYTSWGSLVNKALCQRWTSFDYQSVMCKWEQWQEICRKFSVSVCTVALRMVNATFMSCVLFNVPCARVLVLVLSLSLSSLLFYHLHLFCVLLFRAFLRIVFLKSWLCSYSGFVQSFLIIDFRVITFAGCLNTLLGFAPLIKCETDLCTLTSSLLLTHYTLQKCRQVSEKNKK